MSPSKADFQRFGELLASGAVTIGGYAEQDFLNEYYKVSTESRCGAGRLCRGVMFSIMTVGTVMSR